MNKWNISQVLLSSIQIIFYGLPKLKELPRTCQPKVHIRDYSYFTVMICQTCFSKSFQFWSEMKKQRAYPLGVDFMCIRLLAWAGWILKNKKLCIIISLHFPIFVPPNFTVSIRNICLINNSKFIVAIYMPRTVVSYSYNVWCAPYAMCLLSSLTSYVGAFASFSFTVKFQKMNSPFGMFAVWVCLWNSGI